MKFFLSLLLMAACSLQAQTLNGFWRGTLTQDPGGCFPEYHLELQINFSNNSITGTSYDYYDKSKYVKLRFMGRYNASTKRIMIIESEVMEFNIPKECVPCIKTYDLNYEIKNGIESLTGNWKGNEMGAGQKACPPGKILLQREKTSAFAPDIDQSPELIALEKTITLQPRQKEILKTIAVDTPDIKIELYDNAEIDGDTVTIFVNNKLLLYKQLLTDKPHTIHFNAFAGTDYEFMMYADNMGTIPPNTALMVVTAGEKKYEVRLSSSDQKSAVVKLRFDRKKAE